MPNTAIQVELDAVRDSARVLLEEIGWVRGEFGGLIVALGILDTTIMAVEDRTLIEGMQSLVEFNYARMEKALGNPLIREQLYEPDEDTGDYKLKIGWPAH